MTKNKTSAQGPVDTIEKVYVDIAKKMKDHDLYHMPRLLRTMFTLEEANIVRELPAAFADVAKKLNLSKESVGKDLQKAGQGRKDPADGEGSESLQLRRSVR